MSTKTYAADDYAEIGRRMRELAEQQTAEIVNKPAYTCVVCGNSGWLRSSECDVCGNPMGMPQPGNDGGDIYGDFYAGWQHTG